MRSQTTFNFPRSVVNDVEVLEDVEVMIVDADGQPWRTPEWLQLQLHALILHFEGSVKKMNNNIVNLLSSLRATFTRHSFPPILPANTIAEASSTN